MKKIFDTFRDGIVVLDRDLRVVYANRAFVEFCRMPAEDIVGRRCADVVAEEGLMGGGGECPYAEVLLSGRTVTRVLKGSRADGWGRYLEVEAQAVRGERDDVVQVLLIVRDITEKAKAEEILKRYAEGLAIQYELSTLFLDAGDLMAAIDGAVRMIGSYYDADLTQVFFPTDDGTALRLVAGGGWEKGAVGSFTMPPSKRDQAGFTFVENCPAIVKDYTREDRFDRSPLAVSHGVGAAMTVPMVADERIVGVMGLLYRAPRDIDTGELWYLNVVANSLAVYIEKERYIEKLGRSEAFLASVLEGIGEGLIVVDRDFRILSANKSYAAALGVSRESVVGRRCYEISHDRTEPCEGGEEDCTVQRVFETGQQHQALHAHTDGEGRVRYVETKGYPVVDSSGHLVAAVETVLDVTDQLRLKKDLEKRVAELEDFYEMAVGRELRMIELKEEIDSLRERLGRSPRT
jgi:PAS domain S-box-containing protein